MLLRQLAAQGAGGRGAITEPQQRRKCAREDMNRISGLIQVMCVVSVVVFLGCSEPPTQETQPAAVPKIEESSETKPIEPASAPRGTIEEIKRRGELRVGMQEGYVPFQMLDDQGKLKGFDVDTAHLTARSLMVNLRIVRKEWQDLIPSLLAGETDVIMSAVTVTPKRNERVLFTIPIVETGRMFVVHLSNAERFRNFDSLNMPGTFVVSIPGGLGPLRLRTVLPKASYREFPDRKQALAEVLQKRAHAYIDGEFFIRTAAAKNSESLAAHFKPLTYEPIAWAVRPDDAHWLNWLNNFVRVIRKDGTLDGIKKKWFQDYYLDVHNSPRFLH
ncbi:MAG: transporter substrate-binding domain-containing protein [Desulfomonilaceae bacterium]|nr:transporter substrate-binding domain-containing protein [Desulfomonilaceae bacterium]